MFNPLKINVVISHDYLQFHPNLIESPYNVLFRINRDLQKMMDDYEYLKTYCYIHENRIDFLDIDEVIKYGFKIYPHPLFHAFIYSGIKFLPLLFNYISQNFFEVILNEEKTNGIDLEPIDDNNFIVSVDFETFFKFI